MTYREAFEQLLSLTLKYKRYFFADDFTKLKAMEDMMTRNATQFVSEDVTKRSSFGRLSCGYCGQQPRSLHRLLRGSTLGSDYAHRISSDLVCDSCHPETNSSKGEKERVLENSR